jgi:ankyrin repeat protein
LLKELSREMESDEESSGEESEDASQEDVTQEPEVDRGPIINYAALLEAETAKYTELSAKNEAMDTENKQLQVIINDLARRLQNAQYTIDAQRAISNESIMKATSSDKEFQSMARKFQLEISKSTTINRKKSKDEEAKKYDLEKRRSERLQEDLRFALLDHAMTGRPREPMALSKMRRKVEDAEAKQDSLKSLLQHFSSLEQMTEDLSASAQRGDLETCHRLLASGIGANEVDSAGFLPLHYACAAGFDAVVRLFLEFGADVTSYLTGYAPVEIAARAGHIAVIKVLMEFGADVNEAGKGGSPPLVSAAAAGHLPCVDYLVSELGANLAQSDMQGQSALHVAVKLVEPLPCIHYLLRAGINSKMVNSQGLTAMQVALAISNVAALEALGGRHLGADDGTVVNESNDSVFSESFLDSSIGQNSTLPSRRKKLNPVLNKKNSPFNVSSMSPSSSIGANKNLVF